jgi:hypothetical protein
LDVIVAGCDASAPPAEQRGSTAYSVVVPTLGRRATLRVCLTSISRQTRPPAEVIVALPPDVHIPADHGARVVRAPVASTSAQRNTGARAATSPVVFFVDDDIELEPDGARSSWPSGSDAASRRSRASPPHA